MLLLLLHNENIPVSSWIHLFVICDFMSHVCRPKTKYTTLGLAISPPAECTVIHIVQLVHDQRVFTSFHLGRDT